MATASSRLCMVALHRPNSITGHTARRNRASEVPPVVEGSGSRPVSAFTARAMMSENSPGGVRNGSPEMIGSARPPCFCAISPTISDSEAPEWQSLKRIEMRAFALAGMTLCARFGVSISVISRLLGWNQSVPSSSTSASSSASMATSLGIGLSARCG